MLISIHFTYKLNHVSLLGTLKGLVLKENKNTTIITM